MHIHISDSPAQVARSFAEFFEGWVKERQGPLHIALSGGSTPAVLYRLWAAEFADLMDWEQLHFYWGDERCVPPDDEESNYKMADDLFLSPLQIPSCNIHRMRGELPPEAEAGRYGEELKDNLPLIDGLPVFDLIILGMGGDGHTASIFPGQMELLQSQEICALAKHPVSGQERITLTGPVINNARTVVFLVTGKSKQERLQEILGEGGERAQQYPAAHIKPAHGQLHWFLDQQAAHKVSA